MSGHTCSHIFTDGEVFVWIMYLFIKAEVGMSLRAFERQIGIPNELPFDRAAEQIVLNGNFQCAIRGFSIELINSEPGSPWHNRADNLIGIIKGMWKRRTVYRRIPKKCWSLG